MTFSTLPQRHHGVIYADPPWAFKTYSDKGKGKSPDNHYVCQDMDWIKSLPVADLANYIDLCAETARRELNQMTR
jgi:hypothetical protein